MARVQSAIFPIKRESTDFNSWIDRLFNHIEQQNNFNDSDKENEKLKSA